MGRVFLWQTGGIDGKIFEKNEGRSLDKGEKYVKLRICAGNRW